MSYRLRSTHAAAAILISLSLVPMFAPRAAPDPVPVPFAKICLIDTERILLTSTAGKKAIAELKQQQTRAEEQINCKARELQALQDTIAAGRTTFPPDQLE